MDNRKEDTGMRDNHMPNATVINCYSMGLNFVQANQRLALVPSHCSVLKVQIKDCDNRRRRLRYAGFCITTATPRETQWRKAARSRVERTSNEAERMFAVGGRSEVCS